MFVPTKFFAQLKRQPNVLDTLLSSGSHIRTLYRAEFDQKGFVSNQQQLDLVVSLWLPTEAIADHIYLGEGGLQEVETKQAEHFIAQHKTSMSNLGLENRTLLSRQLEDLTEEEPTLVYDFTFGQWSRSERDCAYFQITRDLDSSDFWIEFSGEATNPPYTEPQLQALHEAHFHAPGFGIDLDDEPRYNPNHWIWVEDYSEDQVSDFVREVFLSGFGAEPIA